MIKNRELLHVQEILNSVNNKLAREERRKSVAHTKNISASEERKEVKRKIQFEDDPKTEARKRPNSRGRLNESSESNSVERRDTFNKNPHFS